MIGFFDSGFGGLCILEAFLKECPGESVFYIADNSHCPYGDKSAEEIRKRSEELVDELVNIHHCRMVVVACNTATAAAIDFLREKYPAIPFVGLEPAIKPALLASKSGVVGVFATRGTFNGRLYRETKERFANGVRVLATIADEWVELVEEGDISSPRAERLVREKVEPILKAGADHLVLGCTHFPHLRALIEKTAAGRAEVVDSSAAVARQARRLIS